MLMQLLQGCCQDICVSWHAGCTAPQSPDGGCLLVLHCCCPAGVVPDRVGKRMWTPLCLTGVLQVQPDQRSAKRSHMLRCRSCAAGPVTSDLAHTSFLSCSHSGILAVHLSTQRSCSPRSCSTSRSSELHTGFLKCSRASHGRYLCHSSLLVTCLLRINRDLTECLQATAAD